MLNFIKWLRFQFTLRAHAIEIIQLMPDDVILFITEHPLSEATKERIVEFWRNVVGGPHKLIVVDGGTELKILRKVEEEISRGGEIGP